VQPVLTVPTNAANNLRRSAVLAACVGGVILVVVALLGHLVMGLFLLLGLALGTLNSFLVQRSVVRFAASEAANKKRQFTMGVLGRLGMITVLAGGCAFLVRPDGLGAIAGLALFQLIMIGGASVPLLKELRQS
jgi:hypothetical protein